MGYWLCRAGLLQSFSVSGLSSSQAARFVTSINLWMARSAFWVVAIGAVVLVFDLRRILRVAPISSSTRG